jgi:hypothetical protein
LLKLTTYKSPVLFFVQLLEIIHSGDIAVPFFFSY